MKKIHRYSLISIVVLSLLPVSGCFDIYDKFKTDPVITIMVDGVECLEDDIGTFENTPNFSYTIDQDVPSDYKFTYGNNISLGHDIPDEPGEYSYVVTTQSTNKYNQVSKSISFTLEDGVIHETEEIKIYAINDFHGAIESTSNRAGAVKLFSFLKNKKDTENALLLDQGDTWQGSIYSNHNQGAMLTDIMNYVQFDARTIGNHDFDWGLDALKVNAARSYQGYTTPTLAANVYDYDFDNKITGNTQQSDIGVKSTIRTLNSGLKVGIVGVIGSNQITSINTLYVKDVSFIDHVDVIKSEATKLRNNGCQVVIASIHASKNEVMNCGLTSYVDLVLCGHSHDYDVDYEGGLCYAQFDCYGNMAGGITLTYDYTLGRVIDTDVTTHYASAIKSIATDSTIQAIINTYADDCNAEANAVLVQRATGSFYSSGPLANVMANAIYDKAVSEGHSDIDLAMLNNARASLFSNNAPFTYSDFYEAFPFDNEVFIANVKGIELQKELVQHRNYFYRSETFTDDYFVSNRTYKIAIIDYLYFHTNTARNYDYFSISAGNYIDKLSTNYRLILREWLINEGYANGSKVLNSANFENDGTNPRFKSFTSY